MSPPCGTDDGSRALVGRYGRGVCGRFTSLTPPEELARIFETEIPSPEILEHVPNYNVAPTTRILAVAVDREGHRRIGRFQWGLVPSWAKDPTGSARLINARSESIFERPSFRHLVPHRRCIVPVDGFYEWRTVHDEPPPARAPKQPVYITRRDGRPVAIAGIWSSWRADESSPWLHTCALVTTRANAVIEGIHDRMPVILEPTDWASWLDPANSNRTEIESLMKPAGVEVVAVRPVTTRVNSVRNNDRTLLDSDDL